MARPVTNTVLFFSHDASACQGRTLSILYNNFGHEGISLWWQLLECLSGTENHVIVIRNLEDVEYLSSKLHFQTDRFKEIIKKLAELDAIDGELYSEGVIWSNNFVERLRPVYEKRKRDLPTKPTITGTITPFLAPITRINITEMPHSRVEYSRGEKSKVDKGVRGSSPVTDLSNKSLPISVTQPLTTSVKAEEKTKESNEKKPYGQFLNVFLTNQEYEKLELRFNSSSKDKIEELSEALKSKAGYDKKYTDHYATILSWARRKEKELAQNKPVINKDVWRVR